MSANSRFAVAVHIMTALACRRREWLSSRLLAASVRTNAVVIRRLLILLRRAGLVEAHAGKIGGVRLARRPERVTLLDVFQAVEGGSLFALPHKRENKTCPVSCSMKRLLTRVLAETDRSIARSLGRVRLSALARQVGATRTR